MTIRGDKGRASLATLIGTASLALPARLLELGHVDAYLPTERLFAQDFARLTEYPQLVIGDLYWSHEYAEDNWRILVQWLRDGGRLLYITGWYDAAFITSLEDFVPVRLRQAKARSRPVPVQWRGPLRGFEAATMPHLHNTYDIESLDRTGRLELDILAVDRKVQRPLIVRRDFPNHGAATIVFGSLSYPAGGNYLLHSEFPNLIHALIGADEDSTQSFVANKIIQDTPLVGVVAPIQTALLQSYAKVLNRAASGDETSLKDAIRLAFQYLTDPSHNDPDFIRELCRTLRRLGKAIGDDTAILYSFRLLLDRWEELGDATFPTTTQEERWRVVLRHWIDQADHASITFAALVDVRNQLEREAAESAFAVEGSDEGGRARHEIFEFRLWLDALEILHRAVEPDAPPSQTQAALTAAKTKLTRLAEDVQANGRIRAAAYATIIAESLFGSPTENSANVTQKLMEFEQVVEESLEMLEDQDLTTSYRSLLKTIVALGEESDVDAWTHVPPAREPFARSLLRVVTRLRAIRQRDPLALLEYFIPLPEETRIELTRALEACTYYRREGAPLTAHIAFILDEKVEDAISTGSFPSLPPLPAELTGAGGPGNLDLAAQAHDVVVSRRSGALVAGRPANPQPIIRELLEGRTEASLRESDDFGVLAYVSSDPPRVRLTTIARSRGERPIEVRFERGRWRWHRCLDEQRLRRILADQIAFGGDLSSEGTRLLLSLLGDVRYIIESSRFRFHGSMIVVWTSHASADSAASLLQGNGQSARLRLAELEETRFATLLSVDGACLVDLESTMLIRYGVQLPVKDEQRAQAAAEHAELRYKGTRHHSGAAYARAESNCLLFIFSQDGGCMIAHNNRVASLW